MGSLIFASKRDGMICQESCNGWRFFVTKTILVEGVNQGYFGQTFRARIVWHRQTRNRFRFLATAIAVLKAVELLAGGKSVVSVAAEVGYRRTSTFISILPSTLA
jgi:methylphosphotriester-DNA--protein-cysteine methyltransferase